MQYFEIFLKFIFLISAMYLYVTEPVSALSASLFLVICLTLGVTLIFNKKASYNFKQAKRDLAIRQMEGWILLVFVLASIFAAWYVK